MLELDDLYTEIENCKHFPVLVEGPRDVRSLEKLGFRHIIRLDKPLYAMVEQLEHEEELLILTDLDDHGRKLYKYFYDEFTRRGVRVNNRLRLLIFQTPVRHIEGLARYLERQEIARPADQGLKKRD
ncbi:TPA: hypothetical protein HA251_07150 [Candidatus Woesearchaeota archaeon]|nr:hypothetical protein [Candidatus Woesearchaeota archaeon]